MFELEFVIDFTNYVSVDYLIDKVFGIIADRAVDVGIATGSASLYGFLK